MDIKININDRRSKRPAQDPRKGRRFEWPTDPRKLDDDQEYVLDICFFDGTTKPDPEDATKYAVVDRYKSFPNVLENVNHSSSDGTLFAFMQNDGAMLTEDLQTDWDGTLSNRPYGIFDRMAMERITYTDFLANSEVLPVGVSRPNFEVKLLFPENKKEAVVVDLKRIFKGGVIGATADVLIDDTKNVGYRCWSPGLVAGHVKLAEKTMNSVFLHFGAAYGENNEIVTDQQVSELEGISWLPFDTSDTDNYKVTRTPVYTDEAYTQPAMKMVGQWTKLRIYTFPRKAWFWYQGRSDGNKGDVTGWGIWMPRLPRDFKMPAPRKTGLWELAHSWDYDLSKNPDSDRQPTAVTIWNEDNAHARFNFVSGSGEADGVDRNAIYTVLTADPVAISGFLGGDVNEWWHVPWLPGGELTDPFRSCWYDNFEPLWDTRESFQTYQGGYNKSTQIIKTMLDLKPPNLFGTRAFHPWTEADPEHPDGKALYLRTIRAYQDSGFATDGIAQKQILYNHGITGIQACGFSTPSTPQTWGIAVGGAKEGDLVAVIECGDGIPLYVWRKTDEEFIPSVNIDYPDPCNYYFARPDCSEFSGHKDGDYSIEVINCRGMIEWPFSEGKTGPIGQQRWQFNRIIRSWGTWFDVTYPNDDGVPVAPHRGTILLERPVSVIAYFGIMPESNPGGIHLG